MRTRALTQLSRASSEASADVSSAIAMKMTEMRRYMDYSKGMRVRGRARSRGREGEEEDEGQREVVKLNGGSRR